MSYVDDLEELRKQCEDVRVRPLFARLLFILARCSRLLVSDGGGAAGAGGAGGSGGVLGSSVGSQTVDRARALVRRRARVLHPALQAWCRA